jgi:hypothetical protein
MPLRVSLGPAAVSAYACLFAFPLLLACAFDGADALPLPSGREAAALAYLAPLVTALATPLLPRVGTKPLIIAGALVAASGLYYLSHAPVDGTFVADLLPGITVVAIGAGCVFTGVTTAATEGVPAADAGLASGLLNASMQFGARERSEEDDIVEPVRGLEPHSDGQPSWSDERNVPLGARRERVTCPWTPLLAALLHLGQASGRRGPTRLEACLGMPPSLR